MKPLAMDIRTERGFIFHGDMMAIDILPRYEIKINLEQHVNHSVEPAKRPLYNQLFWVHYLGWREDETTQQ